MGWRKVGIEFNRARKVSHGLREFLSGHRQQKCHAPEVVVVGVEIAGGLAPGTRNLGLLDAGSDGADYLLRQLVLQVEDILHCAVETVGPDMGAIRRVDQLRRHPQPARRLAHAAFST
jgi:hypothetical protein